MPTTKSEDNKKHGDTLETLIDRTGRSSAPAESNESVDDDAARLQDDEDVENDDVEDRRER
jgi:hypothetical protein